KEGGNNKKNVLNKSSNVKRVAGKENEDAFITTTTTDVTKTTAIVVKKTSLNKIEKKSIEHKEIVDQQDEPLLKPNPRRFVLFPVQYHEVKKSNLIVFS